MILHKRGASVRTEELRSHPVCDARTRLKSPACKENTAQVTLLVLIISEFSMFIVMLTRPATQKITLLCSLKIHNIGPLKLREERINSNAKKKHSNCQIIHALAYRTYNCVEVDRLETEWPSHSNLEPHF